MVMSVSTAGFKPSAVKAAVIRHVCLIGGITLLHENLHVGCRDTLGKVEFTRDLHGIDVVVEPNPIDPFSFL